jgi:DNA-binding transcriptional LysR family regulator
MLERNLGVRLFHRSTRRLTLTEAGEQFLQAVSGNLDAIQAAIAEVSPAQGAPSGILRVSMAPTFGADFILPLLPDFVSKYPQIRLDWRFENRQVDLIGEGIDAAIGGGLELTPGVVARKLAPAHVVAVASPAYLDGRPLPTTPDSLRELRMISMRSTSTGRIRQWTLKGPRGAEAVAEGGDAIVFNDPEAMCRAALLGLGVALVATPHVLDHLETGALIRVLPNWHADAGSISLYYASRVLLPAKTRVFVDHVVAGFERLQWAKRFDAGASA